jgi:TonB-linked outer membrane protein, SusC/RagA family
MTSKGINVIFVNLSLLSQKMKSLLLLLIICLSTPIFGQQKRVTLSLKKVTVKAALEALQVQSDVSFWFSTKDVDLEKIITVKLKSKPIDEVLKIILKGQDVYFEQKADHIIISKGSPVVQKQVESTSNHFSQRLSGIVTDENDQPLPNVSIREREAKIGTVTDADGKFSISVPDSAVTLFFSYIGMISIELPAHTGMKVKLLRDNKQINEIVVTALGITRDKKSLTYSSQSITETEISKRTDLNIATSLSGNIAGIDVIQSSTGTGGSTKIQLRGDKNITSTNQPLFVIDGVPMANYQTSDAYGFYSGRDSGDGLSNINPDDIESMTVLKGANAAALYGSQGSNGVILITTKKGKKGAAKITLRSGFGITSVSELPELQYTYGQTSVGSETSWGTKGNYAYNVEGFFNNGYTLQNSIAMSWGGDKTTAYFSYANVSSTGIMPTNKYSKNNISFRQSTKFLNDKLTVSSNVMLIMEAIHNAILSGYYWNPLLGLYNFPRGLDFEYYKNNYQVLDKNRNIMSQNWPILTNSEGQMNPYWILNNDPNETKTKRMIANASLNYQIDKGFLFSARGTYDYTNQLYNLDAKATSSSVLVSENGRYIYSNLNSWQSYGDLMLTYDRVVAQIFDLHAIVGAGYQQRVIGDGLSIDSNVYGLSVVNNFTIQNIASLSAFVNAQQMASRLIKESIFGNVSVGYKNRVYLDLSGRSDWASSLAFTNNSHYYYPSAGLSLILSQILDLPRVIDFAKVRTSYARVSNEIPSFRTNPTNSVSLNGVSLNTVIPFTKLQPEMQDNKEVGMEMKFLNNRLDLDASYYQIDSKNQYLQLAAPSGSGYTNYYVNAGHIRTRGLELTVNAIPFKNRTFECKTGLNFSATHNKILNLSEKFTGYYQIPGGGEGYDMLVKTGGAMGDIYVTGYQRDANGNILLDDSHVPVKAKEEVKIGNAHPDWMLGWNTNFSYKKFNLSFIVDGKFGGKFVSMTQAYLDANGVTQATADARDDGGVYVSGVMPNGTLWSGMVDARSYYTGTAGRGGIMEKYVYDATNVRLRQLVLGYSLNLQQWSKALSNVNLSLIASNLCFLYKKAPSDPNITISTGNGTQSVENFGVPPTRSFMFSVKFEF